MVVENDPERLAEVLYATPAESPLLVQSTGAVGLKREIARLVLDKFHRAAPEPQDVIVLPEDAPYGRVVVDAAGCTLCLACVSSCPTGALADSKQKPQLRFTEQACVQCGLCRVTCPESVISLERRYNFTPDARIPAVLNEEEPFECIRCGKPFGTKKSIKRVVASLEGKHWMFQEGNNIETLKMCEDCRVIAVAESGRDPYAQGVRPKLRTTDDYLKE